MLNKEEIIALAGAPVAEVISHARMTSQSTTLNNPLRAGTKLYTADQILAVVKPLEFERDVQKADIAFLNKQLAEKDAECRKWMLLAKGKEAPLADSVPIEQLAEKDAEIERLMEKHNALHINARASRDAVERQAAQLKVAREALDAVQQVANRSDGIAGWHLNGDIASWEFILPEVDQALATISDPNEILAERDARVWEKAADFLDGYHYLSANFAAAQEDMRKEAARIREGVKS